MRRAMLVLAIFILGFGSNQLLQSFVYRPSITQPQKAIEILSEATATASLIPQINEENARVVRVIDGDTIELSDGRRVRYIGIDTPETVDPRKPVECFGKEAAEANRILVDGKTVRLEKDISNTDKYGRLLRYVFVNNQMINESLVHGGFAHSSTYPPDVKYQNQLRDAEQEARENKRGLWSGCPGGSNASNSSNTSNTSKAVLPSVSSVSGTSCIIKGNISSSGEKIYHLSGCGSYEKTSIDESRGERWFCTEEEAVTAGWRKAKNCP